MLELDAVDAYYGDDHILFDVNLSVERGEVVSIIGRNGVGKTTTLKSIMNLARVGGGSISFEGEDIVGKPTDEIARMGIGYIPEDRDIIAGLTVEENLKIGGIHVENREERIEGALSRFPALREVLQSKGGHLSGGQQQMLAIARAMVSEHDLLLIDEPTEGLAPRIADDVREAIAELRGGTTILLVEQSTKLVYDISDRVYGMVDGEIVYEGSATDARETEAGKRLLEI